MTNTSQSLTRWDKELQVPKSYFGITEEEKQLITNGCGSEGFLEKIIPDNLIGLDVAESCNIHDWMFHHAKNKHDYKVADETFLENLNAQIKDQGSSLITLVRKGMAYLYFLVVRAYSSLKGATDK